MHSSSKTQLTIVAWINSERKSYDTTPESPLPSPFGEGTTWVVELEQADHRLAKPHKMLICNEVGHLVHEPGVTGQQSEVMMSPASRKT